MRWADIFPIIITTLYFLAGVFMLVKYEFKMGVYYIAAGVLNFCMIL